MYKEFSANVMGRVSGRQPDAWSQTRDSGYSGAICMSVWPLEKKTGT